MSSSMFKKAVNNISVFFHGIIYQALRKSPLSEKVVYEYVDTEDIFLLCMSTNERHTKLYKTS